MPPLSSADMGGANATLEVESLYAVRRKIGVPYQTCNKCGGNNRTMNYLCICGMYAKWFRYSDQLDAQGLRSEGIAFNEDDEFGDGYYFEND